MDNNKKKLMPNIFSNVFVYFFILLAFIIITFLLGHIDVAAFELVIVLILSAYHVRSKKVKNKEVVNYLESLAFYVDSATRDSVLNFPLPMVVLDASGGIIWYNGLFASIIKSENVFEKSIHMVLPDISIQKMMEGKETIAFYTEYGGRFYQVVGNIVEPTQSSVSGNTIILYLVDRTNEHKLEHTVVESEAVSAIVLIDNYDEIIKTVSENERPLATAAIEHKINEWVASLNGVITKYEKDKYNVVFENKFLKEQIDKRFDVLKNVGELEFENKIHATLSIGIGQGGKNLAENYQFASAAVDMALGRGGNQTVIKNIEKFSFFGGNTQEIERRTKVKPRVVAHALLKLAQQANLVLIMGHKNADADVIGSSVGLSRVLRNVGIRTKIVMDRQSSLAPYLVDSVTDNKDIIISCNEAIEICDRYTLLIIVDTHKPSYVECAKLLTQTDQIVVIDHHRKAADSVENVVLSYMEPYASSTCEMVTEIMQYLEETPQLNVSEAQALYAGITLDTKNFTVKTGVRTFEAASFLRRLGVDTVAVKRLFQNDLPSYIKRARIVTEAQLYSEDIAISIFDGEDATPNILISQAADELLNISGVNASFVLCKNGEDVLISGRSLGSINVQLILEMLGGGGHMTVAGAQLQSISIDEAMQKLKEAIDKSRE